MPLIVHKGVTVKLVDDMKRITELRAIMKKHDVNNDQKLSREELKAAFKELGSRCPAWRSWRATAFADSNGDGFIDWEELNSLVDYCLQHGLAVSVN